MSGQGDKIDPVSGILSGFYEAAKSAKMKQVIIFVVLCAVALRFPHNLQRYLTDLHSRWTTTT